MIVFHRSRADFTRGLPDSREWRQKEFREERVVETCNGYVFRNCHSQIAATEDYAQGHEIVGAENRFVKLQS